MRFVGERVDECVGGGLDGRRLRIVNVVLGMHGQVLLDGIVDELKVLGHARVRKVRAVAVEQIVAVGAISVPVDNAHVFIARGGVGDGLIGGADPWLRAARVYKYDGALIAGIGHDGVNLGIGHQAVGAQRKDYDLAGEVLLDITLKCCAARIELAALFGIDVTVGEHAVKGIDGAQGHGVANHEQVVGSVGEAVVVLVGVIGRLLVLGFCIFGFLV